MAELRATVTGSRARKRGPVRLAPTLAGIELVSVGPSAWRDGAAAVTARKFAELAHPGSVRVVGVENQHWPASTRRGLSKVEAEEEGADAGARGAGGLFRSLRNIGHCSGVVAGGALAADAGADVFVVPPGAWKSLLRGGQGRKEARAASIVLMDALGGPRRGFGGAAKHDLAASVAIALLMLGLVHPSAQTGADAGVPAFVEWCAAR